MTSTDYQKAPQRGTVHELFAPRFGAQAPKPISSNRLLGSLKEAASWPGADRNTVVTLALSLVAARADAEGSSYFQDLSERNPADATAQALAGFFQVRAGHDVATGVTKLDKAATMEPGLPQYFRGLALAELLPCERPSGTELAAADDPAGRYPAVDIAGLNGVGLLRPEARPFVGQRADRGAVDFGVPEPLG